MFSDLFLCCQYQVYNHGDIIPEISPPIPHGVADSYKSTPNILNTKKSKPYSTRRKVYTTARQTCPVGNDLRKFSFTDSFAAETLDKNAQNQGSSINEPCPSLPNKSHGSGLSIEEDTPCHKQELPETGTMISPTTAATSTSFHSESDLIPPPELDISDQVVSNNNIASNSHSSDENTQVCIKTKKVTENADADETAPTYLPAKLKAKQPAKLKAKQPPRAAPKFKGAPKPAVKAPFLKKCPKNTPNVKSASGTGLVTRDRNRMIDSISEADKNDIYLACDFARAMIDKDPADEPDSIIREEAFLLWNLLYVARSEASCKEREKFDVNKALGQTLELAGGKIATPRAHAGRPYLQFYVKNIAKPVVQYLREPKEPPTEAATDILRTANVSIGTKLPGLMQRAPYLPDFLAKVKYRTAYELATNEPQLFEQEYRNLISCFDDCKQRGSSFSEVSDAIRDTLS